jgi:O-antigen/teichoic acid export membrane protein
MLHIGIPVLPASLGLMVLGVADRFFLLRYTTLEVVGLYAVGVKLGSVVGLATGAFQTAWYPFALSIAKERDAKMFYAKVLRYYLLLTLTVALLLSNFSKEVLSLFTSPAYVHAYQVVGILACNLALAQAYYIISIGLSLTKNTRQIGWTLGVAIVITLLLDFVLVPWLGMVGAALAPLVANLVSSFLAYRVAQRIYPIPFEWNKIGKIGLISLVIMLVGLNITTGSVSLDISLKVMVSFVIYPGLLLLSGCVDKAEIVAFGRFAKQLKDRFRTSLSG